MNKKLYRSLSLLMQLCYMEWCNMKPSYPTFSFAHTFPVCFKLSLIRDQKSYLNIDGKLKSLLPFTVRIHTNTGMHIYLWFQCFIMMNLKLTNTNLASYTRNSQTLG